MINEKPLILKICFGTIIISFVALTFAIYIYVSKPKIGYVYNSRVLTEYNGIKEGKKLYLDKMESWQQNIDTLQGELNNEINQYKSAYSQLNNKEKYLTEQLLQKKREELINYKMALEDKAKEEDLKLTTAVLNQVDSYILEYGKKHNYDYIFGVTENGNLLYAKEGEDLTNEILNELNNQYAGK